MGMWLLLSLCKSRGPTKCLEARVCSTHSELCVWGGMKKGQSHPPQ